MAEDLDQDGDLDVVGTEALNGTIAWWEQLRDGAGAISWKEHSVSFLLEGGRAAHVADLDGDGDPDLAGAAPDGGFVAWWQNETIHRSALFGPTEVDIDVAVDSPTATAVGDIDGDGALDIASVAADSDDLSWWQNPAVGTSWAQTPVGSFGGTDVLLGDIDLDGDLDIVTPVGLSGFEIFWWQNDAADGSTWTQRLLHLGVTTEFHSLADIDGDGALDLVAHNIFQGDVVWLQNPRNIFDWTLFRAGERSTDALAVGDLDGDGDQDIVGKLKSDPLVWWENTQNYGALWSRQEIDSNDPLDLDEPCLSVGDLDQDGDADVVAIDETSGSLYWWQNKPPSGDPWLRHEIPGTLAGARQILLADLDRDGDLDILGRGQGGGSIGWWQTWAMGSSGSWILRSASLDRSRSLPRTWMLTAISTS